MKHKETKVIQFGGYTKRDYKEIRSLVKRKTRKEIEEEFGIELPREVS